MAFPHTSSADFTEAVDALTQDATLSDSTLHSRAQRYLEIFNSSTTPHVPPGPAWADRIHKAAPFCPPFTTPGLFNAMYEVADELGLVAGRRYVSAAVCVCGEHAARADAVADLDREEVADSGLVRALHQLSSTWAAFLLWPFYARGREDRFSGEDYLPEAPGDETPTAESMFRAQRRRRKEQVMARDNRRCFVSGALDSSVYCFGQPLPAGVTRVVSCRPVSIIPPEVFAFEPDASEDRDFQSDQDIMFDILKRFCGVDAAMFADEAQGPPNTLLMNGSAEHAFGMLLWCLHPTETPDRYEIKNYDPIYDIGMGRPPVSTHVTFVDHSISESVDLPDRALLRAHAALAGVLHRSRAVDAFRILRYDVPSDYYGAGRSAYPASTGRAFWTSVVEYGGPEVSLEVELWEAVVALSQ